MKFFILFILNTVFLYDITEARDNNLSIFDNQHIKSQFDKKLQKHQSELQKQRETFLSAPISIQRMLIFMQMECNMEFIANAPLNEVKAYEICKNIYNIPLNQKIPQLYKEYFQECYNLSKITYDRIKKQDRENQKKIKEKILDDLENILYQNKYKSILPVLLADHYFQYMSYSYALKKANENKDIHLNNILTESSFCYNNLILDKQFYQDFISKNQDLANYTLEDLKEYSSLLFKKINDMVSGSR